MPARVPVEEKDRPDVVPALQIRERVLEAASGREFDAALDTLRGPRLTRRLALANVASMEDPDGREGDGVHAAA